jgi:hypothetical protein
MPIAVFRQPAEAAAPCSHGREFSRDVQTGQRNKQQYDQRGQQHRHRRSYRNITVELARSA